MRSVEKEGRTAEEAIERALEELGVGREEAQIEILGESYRNLFKLLGGRSIRVRATARGDDPLLSEAKTALGRILKEMGIEAEVSGEKKEDWVCLEVKSQAAGLLIGRRGKTLDALQYLMNRILNPDGDKRVRILLDAEGYRAKKRAEIVSFAHRSAEKAKAKGQEVVLVPLGPFERRIIHLELQEDPDIKTFSEGDGYLRKVHVVPARSLPPESKGNEP